MTLSEKNLVQGTLSNVIPLGVVAEELFYGRLFEIDPSLKPMFRGGMKERGCRLMLTLAIIIQGLDRLPELLPAVQDMGRRLARCGVRDEHYKTVAGALLWTLNKSLAGGFTPEVESAWVAVYTMLAREMKSGAMQQAA